MRQAPVRARSKQRRAEIMSAAAALFAQRGFHGVSIDDIGAAAGLSGPGIYRHFPSKEAVLAVLKSWVDSQNEGKFDAYAAHYAPGFVGIKRTAGGGEQKLDLAAWKTDRQKMFKNPMKVAAEHAVVSFKGDQASVTFVQRWQSKGYADHGNKQLRVAAIHIIADHKMTCVIDKCSLVG